MTREVQAGARPGAGGQGQRQGLASRCCGREPQKSRLEPPRWTETPILEVEGPLDVVELTLPPGGDRRGLALHE